MKILRMLVWIIIAVAVVFVAATTYLYFNQKNLVFFPTRELAVTPDRLGLEYEDVFVEMPGGSSIHGWYFTPPDSTAGASRVVLFCHGNAGNISHRLETVEMLLSLGAGVFLFDYRGYGRSQGVASEENVYADARACYTWLVNEKGFAPDEIVIFGRSLGGAVGIDLAARFRCGGLIVESSFTSAADMGKKIFPIFPVKLILKYRFDSVERIGRLSCPVLIVHSPDDDIIPYRMGKALYERANSPKRFLEISGRHNDRDYVNEPTYVEALRGFIHSAETEESPRQGSGS